MYAPQGLPAVNFSVLASSVIIMAARSGLLPPCIVPALGLRLHIPELLSDALFFRRCLRGLLLSVDLPFPYGQIMGVLLYKGRRVVIQPLECLYVRIAVCFFHPSDRLRGIRTGRKRAATSSHKIPGWRCMSASNRTLRVTRRLLSGIILILHRIVPGSTCRWFRPSSKNPSIVLQNVSL